MPNEMDEVPGGVLFGKYPVDLDAVKNAVIEVLTANGRTPKKVTVDSNFSNIYVNVIFKDCGIKRREFRRYYINKNGIEWLAKEVLKEIVRLDFK